MRSEQSSRIARVAAEALSAKTLGASYHGWPLERGSHVDPPKFLPVAVTNIQDLDAFDRAAAGPIEIVLSSGVVLRVGRDCDRRTLRTVLGDLRREETEGPAC